MIPTLQLGGLGRRPRATAGGVSDAVMAAAIWAKVVSAYPFDGALYDLKGGNHQVRNDSFNDGTMTYATGIGGASGAAKIKRWISGQGNVDNINCRNTATNLPTGAFSIGGFFKFLEAPSGAIGAGNLFLFGGDWFNATSVVLRLDGGSPAKLQGGFSTPSDSTGLTDLSRSSANLSNGQRIWATVERTAGGVAAVYFDNVQSGATVTDATALSANDTVASGGQSSSLPETLLDELFILNAELTTAERAWLYNGGTGRSWWDIRTLAAVAYTLNPNDKHANITLSAGNMTATKVTAAGHCFVRGSTPMLVDTQWEIVINSAMASTRECMAITTEAAPQGQPGATVFGYGYNGINGVIYHAGAGVTTVATYDVGDVISGLYSPSAQTFKVKKNNTLLYTVTGVPAGAWFPTVGFYDVSGAVTVHFTAGSLVYGLDSGYVTPG